MIQLNLNKCDLALAFPVEYVSYTMPQVSWIGRIAWVILSWLLQME